MSQTTLALVQKATRVNKTSNHNLVKVRVSKKKLDLEKDNERFQVLNLIQAMI